MGLLGLATALRDQKGRCRGAIGMTVQAQKHSIAELRDEMLPPLREAALMLRQVL
ncbi:MAG TPA: hypothetical protein VLJ62_20670 [Burkholderiaceae bacterium]|nr:hypothetical protein [Burkholderiaceae bacterium]